MGATQSDPGYYELGEKYDKMNTTKYDIENMTEYDNINDNQNDCAIDYKQLNENKNNNEVTAKIKHK